ncbi:hypothetical protein CDAR_548161 [Caerostris darwini]|uniref:Uncharacterized protein n=1 Tax=Caerostris darwini TaxID=1538125 RepID=A0AAV4WFN1_9ARAC|nr:hypothetical protein CDAR_548161 [Caerostris darwini]
MHEIYNHFQFSSIILNIPSCSLLATFQLKRCQSNSPRNNILKSSFVSISGSEVSLEDNSKSHPKSAGRRRSQNPSSSRVGVGGPLSGGCGVVYSSSPLR